MLHGQRCCLTHACPNPLLYCPAFVKPRHPSLMRWHHTRVWGTEARTPVDPLRPARTHAPRSQPGTVPTTPARAPHASAARAMRAWELPWAWELPSACYYMLWTHASTAGRAWSSACHSPRSRQRPPLRSASGAATPPSRAESGDAPQKRTLGAPPACSTRTLTAPSSGISNAGLLCPATALISTCSRVRA